MSFDLLSFRPFREEFEAPTHKQFTHFNRINTVLRMDIQEDRAAVLQGLSCTMQCGEFGSFHVNFDRVDLQVHLSGQTVQRSRLHNDFFTAPLRCIGIKAVPTAGLPQMELGFTVGIRKRHLDNLRAVPIRSSVPNGNWWGPAQCQQLGPLDQPAFRPTA